MCVCACMLGLEACLLLATHFNLDLPKRAFDFFHEKNRSPEEGRGLPTSSTVQWPRRLLPPAPAEGRELQSKPPRLATHCPPPSRTAVQPWEAGPWELTSPCWNSDLTDQREEKTVYGLCE